MKEHEHKEREELQKLYVQHQMLKHQMSAYTEQATVVESKIAEMTSTIETINSMKNVKPGTESLTNIGSQAFLKTEVNDTKNVVIEIGAGIFQNKKLEEALKILEERKEELVNMHNHISTEVNKMSMHLQQIEPELKRLVEKIQ